MIFAHIVHHLNISHITKIEFVSFCFFSSRLDSFYSVVTSIHNSADAYYTWFINVTDDVLLDLLTQIKANSCCQVYRGCACAVHILLYISHRDHHRYLMILMLQFLGLLILVICMLYACIKFLYISEAVKQR